MTQTIAPPTTAIQPPNLHDGPRVIRINAALIADAHHSFAPGSLILQVDDDQWIIHAINTQAAIDQLDLPSDLRTLDLPDQIIIPPLINAHTHLDLTHIGPQPHNPSEGFVPWLDMIRANRILEDDAIAGSVTLGIEKSLAGGTIAVGDIAGAPNAILKDIPIRTLAHSPMLGTSFLEFFGIGTTATTIIDALQTYLANHLDQLQQELHNTGVTFGLSPHATNTISIAVYHRAAQLALKHNIPLCTHLAETLEEREFISKGTGPQRGFLERFGIWDDSILSEIGKHEHPIEHLHPVLKQLPILCAHVNDAPTDDEFGNMIELLATTQTSVAYCPRAHTYFGHYDTLGPHPFQAMLDAGINVTLGTDSIVNLNTPDRITTLDDMRLLASRDQTPMHTLLSMTTTNPAHALRLDPNAFRFESGHRPAGLLSLAVGANHPDPWSSVMHSGSSPNWILFAPKNAVKTGAD